MKKTKIINVWTIKGFQKLPAYELLTYLTTTKEELIDHSGDVPQQVQKVRITIEEI